MSVRVFWLTINILLWPPSVGAAPYVGAGGGIVRTGGPAFQLAVPVYRGTEVHFSSWRDDERASAAGIGFRFDNGSPVSVVLGLAYVDTITENLLRRANAYVEVRVRLFRRFSCQASHYSSIGNDNGENMLLCGVQWGSRAQ